MSSFNPIRRSPIKPKARRVKPSWRNPERVRLDGPGLSKLRGLVFQRAGGQCENKIGGDNQRCSNKITWWTGDLHHVKHRSQGGGDTEQNCIAVCWPCHRAHHNQSLPIAPWWEKA